MKKAFFTSILLLAACTLFLHAQESDTESENMKAHPEQYGWMKINYIEFGNTDRSDNILTEFGSPLQAAEVQYLSLRLNYDNLTSKVHTVKVQVKLFDPDGQLMLSEFSGADYTYDFYIDVLKGNRTMGLGGWGRNSGGSYRAGTYKAEVWYEGRLLHTQEVELLSSDGVSYLKVEGARSVTVNYSPWGGREIINVSTDAAEYTVEDVPSWITIEDLTSESFYVNAHSNMERGLVRECVLKVKAGIIEVEVVIHQRGVSLPEIKSEWYDQLKAIAGNRPDFSKGDTLYRGYLRSKAPNGLGMLVNDEMVTVGDWKNGVLNGIGFTLVKDYESSLYGCEGCVFFVGEFKEGQLEGEGTCYDKHGRILYSGKFQEGVPEQEYPAEDTEDHHRIQYQFYEGGDYYIGEMIDGQRNGYGIYMYANGDAWYGPWKDGKRNGFGLMIYTNGSNKADKWED